MRKHLLLLANGFLVPALLCAQIPNGGFETWSPSGMGYDDPDGWVTWNTISFPIDGTLNCEEGSPGAVGASFAKVTTLSVTGVGILPGFLFTGDMSAAGFPYASRPAAMNGMYQYNIPAGDGGTIAASFTKWVGGAQTSVGGGVMTIAPGSQSSWGSFSIPITWLTADYPDTAVVTVMSSTGGGVAGSTVWVDDLEFGAFTGVHEAGTEITFTLAPSPATDVLTIAADRELREFEVIDLSGRVRAHENVIGRQVQVDVRTLADGMYVGRLRFADGTIANRTFVKN
ncbi:MAG: hypothetical protein IT225_01320 [Flavobacteriales bacterium]|jgi:hypothetical protein|nr:hypothetical protein [Flavobacteriales bacterium]